MGEKIVDIKVNQDLGDGVEKIETQSQAGDKFKATMSEAAETMKDLPGFERYQTTANASWNAASDRLMNAAKQVVHDPYATKYETGRRQADFKFQQDVLSATYNDLQKTAEAASKLSQAIGKHNGFKDLMTRTFPSMLTMTSNAMKLFEGSHKSLGDPTRMRFNFMRQMEEAAKTNPHGDIAKMAKILGSDQQSAESVWNYLFQVGSPQHKRASFMEKMSKDVSIDGTRYRNFRESLPASFAKLPVRHTQMIADADWDKRQAADAVKIQEKELDFLQARMMSNRVLMDAAVDAGIAQKSNGRLLMNQNAPSHGQVNMMGSYVMRFMENALRGMPMHEITDIENPDVWDKLERKNNKRFNMAREAMEVLDEFKWLNPTHYTEAQAKHLKAEAGSAFKDWENAPVIKHSPIYKAFEVPAYKIGDSGNLVEDAHLAIEDSIAMRTIMRHGSGIQPHNALTKDTVYVNIDKRLNNPDLDPYTQNMLLDKYANLWENGFTPNGAEEKYVAVGVSKDRGIQFVRQSIYEKAIKADPGIFTGGHVVRDAQGNLVPQMDYNSWKAFSAAIEYSRKPNTPGEDSSTLYGSSLKGKKIVVFDPTSWQKKDNPEGVLGKIPGLDGASFADSSIIPMSAQGRMQGVKTVLNSVNMKELHKLYAGEVKDDAGEVKDARVLMLRAASGVDGAEEQVEFTKDTDLLISKNDIKDFDRRFAGKTNAEITEAIRKDIEAGGLSIKTTFSDADKNSRWMSAQLAQTLNMTPDDQRMFNKVFIDELARAGTLGGAVDSVFAGNQSMQDMLRANPQLLDTSFVQSQIREYRQNMIRRKSRGDVLLPKEMKAHRQMFAPWIFDVMNQSLLAANPDFQLPDYLENLSLKDHQIVALNSWAEKFGISRLPATIGSVQLTDNMASAEQEDAEGKLRSFAKFAALVGLDPEGLYLNPNSSILAALQGADFDGDIGEIIEFASNDHNDYNAVVQHILERTIDSHKKKIEAGTLTAEAAAAKQEKLKHTLEANDQKFSMSSGKDIAKFILHSAQNTARIGSASAVNRNAFQMDQAENFVLQALVDAYEHYDTNTTSVKKGITMDASLNERKVLNYGAPFSEFFRRVDKKGRDDNGNISIEKLRELNTNLYSFNLPTKYMSGNMLSALASRYIAKQQYGEDVVNGDYDWNKLFDELHGEADLSTALGRMQYGLRQAYLGFLNSDYLALSEEDASTLVELRQKAIDDITAHSDLYTDELAKYQNKKGNLTTAALAERMVNALGGKAIKNLNQDGLTETVMNSANFGFLLDSMNSMGFGSGTSSLTGFLMSQFGENAEIYEKAIQDRQKAAQEDREKRMKFFNAWGSDKADEIASNLDKHSFSYSDLKSFADNPEEWLYYAMNPKVKREHRSTDATVIGSASHKIIQDYFDAREKMIKKHSKGDNKFKFTDREIEELSKNNGQDLGAYFEKLLTDGYTAPNGKKKESIGQLGSGILEQLKNNAGSATLQRQFDGVRNFLSNNMHARMMELFNPKEWEYLPNLSEQWLGFNDAQFGKQINQPDNAVKMSGRADLVFKKRKQQKNAEDEYFIVDMKNFGDGMSEESADYMRNQLYLYALADNFQKKTQNGETPETVASNVTRMGFLLPAQNEFREVEASPEVLETAHAKYSAAIAQIQGLAQQGLLDDYIRQIQRNIAGSLFGAGGALKIEGLTSEEIEKAREAYFANERAQYTSNELSGATIGKTLVMHEDYKEYLDNIHAVTKFANKQDEKFGDAQHYDMWKINAKKIEAAKEQARTLELRGMTEESARQSSETSYAETRFKEALKKAAPGDLQQTYDLLRKINNEETPSKGLTEKLDQYQQLKQRVQSAADAFNYLNDQITETNKQKKDAGKAVAKALAESRTLATEEKTITDGQTHPEPGSDQAKRLKEIAQRREELRRQYIDNQQKGKTSAAKVKDMTETQKEAAKNKESLDEETKRFEQKFRDDVLKYWEQVGTEFDQTRALTPQSKTASIQDLISGYKNSVINELAAMDDMAKGKEYDWFTEDSDLYKKQRAELQKHLDPSKISEYQKNLIGRALTDAEQWNNANYAVLTGEELDPRIAASMQAKAIAERIAEQKLSFEQQFEGVTLNEGEQNRYNAIKKLLDSFNEEDQVNKLTARAEFDKTEKAARDTYSLQADKQKQEDAIAAWRERIAARQSGKPYSPAAQQEREFQARMAAEEEQLRRYEAEAKRKDATKSEKENAQARADSTRQYINDMRTLHAEELRVGATADLRDLNASFEKQISRQGMSSAAISYAEQFDQLAKSIENASQKYDELKKKIEEQQTKGETPDASDLQALADAEKEKVKAEANAKILKENQMDQQRTSNTARVDAFYNQFSAARTSSSGPVSGEKWTAEQASRLKELEARAEWSKQHGAQENELNSLIARSKQAFTPAEWDEAMQLQAEEANPLSPNESFQHEVWKSWKDRHESVTEEDEAHQAQGQKLAQENNIQNRFGDNPERLDGYTKKRDINRFNRISSALQGKLSHEKWTQMVALQEEAWEAEKEGRRLPKDKRDALKNLRKRYDAYEKVSNSKDAMSFYNTGLELKQQQAQELAASAQNVSAADGYLYPKDKQRVRSIQFSKSLELTEKDEKTFQELEEKKAHPLDPEKQQKLDNYRSRWEQRLTPEQFNRMNALLAERQEHGLSAENEQKLEQLRQAYADYQAQVAGTTIGNIPVKTFDSRVSDAAKQADQKRKQLISDLKAEQTETKDAVRQSEIQAQIDGLEGVSLEQMEQYYRQQFAEESNRVTENNAYRVRRLEAQGRRMDRDKYGMRDRSIFGRANRQRLNMRDQYEDRIDQIQIQKTELQKHQNSSAITPEDYSKTAAQIANLDKQLKEAQKGFKTFSSGAATGRIALNELGQSASRVIAQFGRQLFHKALQEAKQFVMEFDSAMTEIQMITLKTDDEIAKLGDQLIQTSMDMKVSVSDVTSAASDLYRQGLSDDEVSVRLEDVVKFAKVAGIKTEEASKIITTALSNGLVDSSEEAMDALVALGDSAATTANEIAKGMQKSAASAKEAGVNYEQLVTMLTIITSKTQLGGSSAGTALSTLFYRLQKVGSSEGFYDENGNLHADTETARALKGIGVDLFNEDGSFRGAYDVLVDIAKNWESASDVQQSMVLNSLGAGRQRSNMATLIQGLSEDDGALADKYLNLAANSEGITDQKYGHYLDTLEASLTNVTNAFDQLVASFNMIGVSTGFFDWITDAISGLTSFNEMLDGTAGTIAAVTAAVVTLSLALAANPVLGLTILGIGGALLAASGIGGLYEQSQIDHANMVGDKTLYEYSSDRISNVNRMHDESAAILDETEALLELRKSQALTAEESEKLDKNMKELERRFGVIDEQLNITSDSYEDLIKVTKEYRMENDKIRALEAKEALSKFQHHVGTDTVNDEINDISSILMLRNQDNAHSDLVRWFKEHVQPGATLVANHVQDPLYMQFLWNMITHGPLGEHKISEDYTLKQELGYSDAQTSSDTLGKFLIAHPNHWKMVVEAVVKDMDKRSFEDYVEDQIYDSEMADLSHEGLDNWLNSKLSYIELAMSATPASQEQTSQILETFATNVRSNSDFYTGDPETIANILRKEITALSSLIFPVGGEFDQAGLDTYNKRYSFNGQTNLTAGGLAAAKQRYIDEQTKEYFGNHDFTDASTARRFLKINNLYNEDGFIKGIDGYQGRYFEDNENGYNAIVLANAWRTHKLNDSGDNIVFSTIYDETNNPFDLPETSDYIQPKDPASDSGSDSRVDQLRSLLDQSTGTGEWSKRDTDNMIKTLLENDVKGLDEVYDLFLAGTLNLNGLLNAFPEIASELEKYAIYDAEGVLTGFESGVDAFMYILDMIAGVSDVFSGSSFISMREKAAGARAIFTSFNRKDFDTDGRAKWLQEIVGSELYAKIQTPGAISLEGVDGPTNINDLFGPDLTGSEDAYVKTILSNAVYGIQGLTEQQRFEGARSMFELSKGEGFHNFMKSNASGMTSDYASAIEGGADYFYAAERLSEEGYSSDKLATIKESGTGYEKINEILEGTGYSLDTFLEKQKEIDKELETRTLRLFKAYGDSTENVIANFEQWDGKASDVASAMSEFNSAMSKAQRNAWLREQANGDNWTDEVVEGIAEMTGYSKEYIEEHKEDVKGLLETYKNADLESVREEMSGLDEAFSAGLNDSQWALEVHPDIKAQLASGYNLDFSQVGNQLKGYVSDAFLAEVQNAVNSGVTGYVHVTQDADGKVHAQLVVEGINSSGYTPPPRGGGGGKSAADKLLESHNREQTIRDHIIKMIQYEESMYQNAGQLTNYGIMLQHEIDEEKRQVAAKKEQIAALEKQISKTKKYSDDWYTLRDAIMKAEEEYEELTNTIEENNKKLEENQQAILKLHTELEQTVKQEIETRIQEEREMLDGTVSMQETIVEAIRERYREEWELMQKDIEKKRKALEEEKALIDERLNRRKEAEDEAKKHEELAEYQKQLALISMDPTRTSDVATLREKIQALEEELAWDLAEDEAKMQQDALQDQIDAYDQYEQEYQEWLDKYLEDANNFTDEVNHVMGLGHDELMQWLKDNVTEFGNSLEAAQEQMVQGWDDTFKQMKGIVDTYWDEINKTLSSKENFIAYMQESSSYKNASEDEKKQMLYNWGKAYDDYIAASVVSNEAVNYKHSDDFKGSSSNKSNTKKDKAPAATPESRYELLSLEEEIKQSLAKKTFAPIAKFAEGGLVDYTGPAWVDGTKTKPESFLDAEDTSLLRAMLDGWKHVRNLPFMSNVSGVAERGDGMSIGEVNVTLNEAQFNTDDDYETIAQKVGAAFTKELAKQGFSTARYAF